MEQRTINKRGVQKGEGRNWLSTDYLFEHLFGISNALLT